MGHAGLAVALCAESAASREAIMVVKGSWPLRVRGGTAPKSSAPGWALLLLPTALHLGCGAHTSLDPGAGGAHVVQHGDKNSEAVATSASFA